MWMIFLPVINAFRAFSFHPASKNPSSYHKFLAKLYVNSRRELWRNNKKPQYKLFQAFAEVYIV